MTTLLTLLIRAIAAVILAAMFGYHLFFTRT
jgi:hypothetical protein